MPRRYPRGAQKPRKPWKSGNGLPCVVGGPSISRVPTSRGGARWSDVIKKADENRKNPTKAESKFQSILSELKIGYKSQYVVSGKYILDFFLWDTKTGIEIDGPSHSDSYRMRKYRDKERECTKKGIKIIRYSNHLVHNRSGEIVQDLLAMTGNPGRPKELFVLYEDALAALKARGGGYPS